MNFVLFLTRHSSESDGWFAAKNGVEVGGKKVAGLRLSVDGGKGYLI